MAGISAAWEPDTPPGGDGESLLPLSLAEPECRPCGESMREVSGGQLLSFDSDDPCSGCSMAVNAHTIKFETHRRKKEGCSLADFAIFQCPKCSSILCWECSHSYLESGGGKDSLDGADSLSTHLDGDHFISDKNTEDSKDSDSNAMASYFQQRAETNADKRKSAAEKGERDAGEKGCPCAIL